MKNKFSFCWMLLISVSCSHSAIQRSNRTSFCDFDPVAKHESLPDAPFVMEFSRADGIVVFVAADHGEESQNKKTFDLIRNAFATHNFARSIVEGLENSEGVSPKKYIEDIKAGHRKLSESAFLALESQSRNVEFIGGEVPDKELLGLIQEKGYSQKDMAGLYVLRTWGNDPSLSLGKLIDSKRFPIQGQFVDPADFQSWLKGIYGHELPQTRDPRLSRPFQNRKDRLQSLVNEITWARDRFLAKVISHSYKEKHNILVVYGSGHALSQKCFLSDWDNN